VQWWRVGAHINRISVKKDRKTSKNIKIWPFLTFFGWCKGQGSRVGARVRGWCTYYNRIRVKKDRKTSKNIKIWLFLTIVQSLVLCNYFPTSIGVLMVMGNWYSHSHEYQHSHTCRRKYSFPTSIYSWVTHFLHTRVIPYPQVHSCAALAPWHCQEAAQVQCAVHKEVLHVLQHTTG
jgi:hypothetical protein